MNIKNKQFPWIYLQVREKRKKINLYKFPVQLLSDKRQGGNLSGIRDDDDDDDK